MATVRRTRSLTLSSWRGTPEELKTIADAAAEAMEVARDNALKQYEASQYERYRESVTALASEFGISDAGDLSLLDLNFQDQYTSRIQELWRTTQQLIDQATGLISVSQDLGWRVKGGVEESGNTPDLFSGNHLPRGVVGIWIRSNMFARPNASISLQLQNAPYPYLQLEVSGEDWVWMEASFSRLSELVRRGESSKVGVLYRPVSVGLIIVATWLISSLILAEVLRSLPYQWLMERNWLAIFLGIIPVVILANAIGWLYPRFEVLRSIAREQTDAARWLIVGLATATALALARLVISLTR